MMRRLWTAFYCRWLLTPLWCAVKGHDWAEQHVCLAMGLTACTRCGHLMGQYRKDNGRERCSRLVIVKPGLGRMEVAKYPPIGPDEFLPGDGPVTNAPCAPSEAPYGAEGPVPRVPGPSSDGESPQ